MKSLLSFVVVSLATFPALADLADELDDLVGYTIIASKTIERWYNDEEKDDSFKGSIGAIYQTFGKKDVYPSIEEKAAHLLYFTIKNHSFVDGNKRIAAAIFLWYLEMNNYLYNKNGLKRIADNALVGLCLLIAQSDPKERDTVVKVIVNLINTKNM